jgi:chaperonin GroEL
VSTHAQLSFHHEARAKLLAGATALADAVRPTLGPEAHSVLLESKYGSPTVCDDGVTIAKRVDLQDPEENLGARLLRNAAVRTGEAVGDGTTTSTLLGHTMVAEGMRNVVAGTSAIGMRRGMYRALDIALESINDLSRPVKDRSDMVHVATVSAHDNSEIGELVANAVGTVGGEGVVEVEDGRGTETVLEVVEGVQFDKGFLSPTS